MNIYSKKNCILPDFFARVHQTFSNADSETTLEISLIFKFCFLDNGFRTMGVFEAVSVQVLNTAFLF